VARAVRRTHPELPIIFVTGYAETEQLEAALGPDVPILRKPFTVAQLAVALDDQLPGSSLFGTS
jgi:CheY-like chemotaxis protein